MPFGWRYYSAHVREERSGHSDLACICKNGRAFPKAEPASFTDFPPSHYEVGSCVGCNDKSWAWVSLIFHAVLPLRPLILIDVSRGAPCTECATWNLGTSIIPQLTSPWHLQPPIYSRFKFFFPFPSLPFPTKRSKCFLPSQKSFEPVPHHWKIETIPLYW